MTRSIITGGTGFVGANLARRLLREGHDLHLLVRAGHSSWRIADIKAHVQLHLVDLADGESLESIVKAIRPEMIFHLAAHGAYSSQTDIRKMIETNIQGTVNLVESCLKTGFSSFINTGSSSEYGFKSHAPSENEWLEPNSYYAITKASASQFCRFIAQKEKVNLQTLRLYSVYGPYEEPARLMPTLILKGLDGKLPPLADPDTAHDFVYVDDVCDAYLLAAEHADNEYGAIYNVGTGRQITLREVVEVARTQMSIQLEPVWNSMPARAWDTKSWAANSEKIQTELGWKRRYNFEQGFSRMLEWFREHTELHSTYQQA